MAGNALQNVSYIAKGINSTLLARCHQAHDTTAFGVDIVLSAPEPWQTEQVRNGITATTSVPATIRARPTIKSMIHEDGRREAVNGFNMLTIPYPAAHSGCRE
jgi:hypothetical protein